MMFANKVGSLPRGLVKSKDAKPPKKNILWEHFFVNDVLVDTVPYAPANHPHKLLRQIQTQRPEIKKRTRRRDAHDSSPVRSKDNPRSRHHFEYASVPAQDKV